MAFRILITSGSIEVSFDTEAEGLLALATIQPLMPLGAKEPPKQRPEHGPRPANNVQQTRRQARRKQQLAGWASLLKTIGESPHGLDGYAICNHLGLAGPPGIGRSLIPVKKFLDGRGFDGEWDGDVIARVSTDDGVIWLPGPRIAEAIQVLEGRQDGQSRENGSLLPPEGDPVSTVL